MKQKDNLLQHQIHYLPLLLLGKRDTISSSVQDASQLCCVSCQWYAIMSKRTTIIHNETKRQFAPTPDPPPTSVTTRQKGHNQQLSSRCFPTLLCLVTMVRYHVKTYHNNS
uniref:Uncharacterized protein n=1 Tax=Homalodisca liturata TaxID=320908 RepID=A0A1B6K6T9_9HEMI